MYFVCRDIKYELIHIITVKILVLKMYHTIVSIFVTVTWTCDSKSLLYNMLVYIVTYVHIVT